MEIKPAYITFEQAKLLKEKGFSEPVKTYYRVTGSGIFESPAINHNDDKTQETAGGMTYVSAPEHWRVCEWLRVKHGIWVNSVVEDDKWTYGVFKTTNSYGVLSTEKLIFSLPQEAYSAAFDYILTNLI